MMNERANLHSSYQEAVRVALLMEWDPIGIKHHAAAADEYDAYVPDVVRLLMERKSESEMFVHLWRLETDNMGLEGDRPATARFANRLMQIQRVIDSMHPTDPKSTAW